MRHRFRALGIVCLVFSTAAYAAGGSDEFGFRLIPLVAQAVTPGQVAPTTLMITVIDGESAVNDIKARIAREPVVEITDENHKPVAGAAVTFFAPSNGPGGAFAGNQSLTVLSDSSGRAVGHGFKPNHNAGQFQIEVTVTLGAVVAKTIIRQTNMLPTGTASTTATTGGVSSKVIIILAVVAAAGAAGLIYGLTRNGNSSPSATIGAPGTVTVGTPH
ncbi:MAG TPA: hypothetical protein VH351_09015 [Bryobacteraceae bacterium]|jgi:hypothetical protein|nr:hypothetical protein [Bryobacteraceae bacterium]